ncbi:MAG: hypothetical protein HQ536_01525 [Parcubacteria group bacterium]|nr:hypothetical protein [Parcubacteria group bacterium]
MRKLFLLLIISFIWISCATPPPITPETALQSDFYYSDSKITIAVNINQHGVLGYAYDFFIQNIDNKPLRMNCVYDVLQIEIDSVIYQPKRLTPPTQYPSLLNPGTIHIDYYLPPKGIDITKTSTLHYQHQDKRYTIPKQ